MSVKYTLKENLEYLESLERINNLKNDNKIENLSFFSKMNTAFAIISISFSVFIYFQSKSFESALIVFFISSFLLSIGDVIFVLKNMNKNTKKKSFIIYNNRIKEIRKNNDFLFELNILLDNENYKEQINDIVEKENYYNLRSKILKEKKD